MPPALSAAAWASRKAPLQEADCEFSYKDDSLGDPFINDDYAREMNAATEEECAFLKNQARIVNDVLIDFFKQAGLTLVDFKIEFGRLAEDPSQIVLADEFLRIPAACGTSRPARRWTRTASARTSAT